MIRHIVTDKRTGEAVYDGAVAYDVSPSYEGALGPDFLPSTYDTDTHEVRDGRVVPHDVEGEVVGMHFDSRADSTFRLETRDASAPRETVTVPMPDPRDARIRVLEAALRPIAELAPAYAGCAAHSVVAQARVGTEPRWITVDDLRAAATVLSRKGG